MAFFRQKLGPLELWQWAALALVGLLAYFYFTKSGFFSGSGGSSAPSGSGTGDTSLSDLLNALASMGQPANSGASGSNAVNSTGGQPTAITGGNAYQGGLAQPLGSQGPFGGGGAPVFFGVAPTATAPSVPSGGTSGWNLPRGLGQPR